MAASFERVQPAALLNRITQIILVSSLGFVIYIAVTFPPGTPWWPYVFAGGVLLLWGGLRHRDPLPPLALALGLGSLIVIGVASRDPFTVMLLLYVRAALHAFVPSTARAVAATALFAAAFIVIVVLTPTTSTAPGDLPVIEGTLLFFIVGSLMHILRLTAERLERALAREVSEGTARVAAASQEAEQRAEARFRTLVQHAADVVLVVDREGVIRFETPSVRRVLGLVPGTMTGRPITDFVHGDAHESLSLVMAGGTSLERGTFDWSFRHADGSLVTCEVLVEDLAHDPAVAGVVLTIRDVTARRRLEDQLRRQAFEDPLTGLPNRALILDRLGHALAARSGSGTEVALIVLDLDDFKLVNDSLGHAAGDALLVGVGERLRGIVRMADTVGRVGGDEFVVLVDGVIDPAEGSRAAVRVGNALARPFESGDREIHIRSSIGVVVSSDQGVDAEVMLRNADTAMLAAKARGGGSFEVYRPALRDRALARLQVSEDLRGALARDELVMVYQPIVALESGRAASVEALVRWRHPTRGPIGPDEFVRIAEDTGLIGKLGRWTLEAAAEGIRRLERTSGTSLAVSVNLSPKQLVEPGVESLVATTLEQAGLPPDRLTLEVTEGVLVEDPERSLGVMLRLKALGVRLAIDDFGTGYSSLSYLQRFPFDILKIDKAFIDGVAGGAEESAVARAIVRIGRTLERGVIAEGVERAEQAEVLRSLGCLSGQGYLYSPPLDLGGLQTWLLERARYVPLASLREEPHAGLG